MDGRGASAGAAINNRARTIGFSPATWNHPHEVRYDRPYADAAKGPPPMTNRIALSLLCLAISTPALANEISIDFSWHGVPACQTLSRSPRITIRGFPKDAKKVLLILTQGKAERGGQEVDLPASGELPEGAITTFGPCNPGIYRWTAIFKSASGETIAEARVEKPFPQ
jgi:hypothetical protein